MNYDDLNFARVFIEKALNATSQGEIESLRIQGEIHRLMFRKRIEKERAEREFDFPLPPAVVRGSR